MLKKSAIKRIIMSSLALVITLLLCLFPQSDEAVIPSEVVYVEEMTMPIYAVDQNSYVARTNIAKNEKEQIKYIIDALTIDSLTNSYLPSGFTGTIPKGTKLIDYSLNNKLLKLNFSKEILNVSLKEEERMLESLIYSLCELEEVDNIMIFVENNLLENLPNSNKKITYPLDKNYGINKTYNFDNIKNTTKTTIYYMGKYNDELYYIPITKITNEKIEAIEVIVSELKSTPIYETNLISYLNASYELKDYEILENSITLSFNNLLLANLNEEDITEKVKYSLALSLRDTYNIEDIVININ